MMMIMIALSEDTISIHQTNECFLQRGVRYQYLKYDIR